ncbi:hybrid sensor histidine kinase/response regulator [Desertivirga xinjiangensis]|uniref:hybrid sensor histidine kinase/response regulator n=1 Tax=Desertivirga xinjiangensis TaxID=539206 RepID=UPI00210BC962|nr:ATP-binding protein [Pedobacter xinjiangensis]
MQFIKGKVIVAFLSGCIALFFAWEASRQASIQILGNVDSLSTPVDKLHLVNQLFRDINKLEQLQRAQAIQGKDRDSNNLRNESLELRKSLDNLGKMYTGDSSQLARIASMKKILRDRDSLFSNYMRVREGLVSGKELSRQLGRLTSIYSKSPVLVEKIITTEKTSTITINPPGYEDDKKASRGFLGRLFGKKRDVAPETTEVDQLPHEQLASETVDVKIDTISSAAQVNPDSLKREIDKARRTIVSTQRLKSTSFIDREAALTNAGNILINQMLNILQEVEKDALAQVERNNSKTKGVVEEGARNIINIILLFVLATAILLYLILTDISRSARYRNQLELAKDEAEHHSAVRQRFLANMSHEIRTPLQSIIGYSEQLRQGHTQSNEAINAIHYSSEHLLQIVNEILDYSRLASGKFSLNFGTFSLKSLLQEIIALVQPQASKKALALILEDHTQADQVIADSFRLKQILLNLISNAIKFTDEGSVTLCVRATETEHRYHFVFQVADTGHGIPKDSFANIFNQFEQVNTSAVAATKGTGLGLSIVKELVELQGGSVTVESELGRGTTFEVRLGFAKPTAVLKSSYEVVSNFPANELDVYLVDDDQLILQLVCSIFEKHHIRYHCFTSPLELLNNLKDPDKSVVMADIRMPEMSGIELCTELRKKSSSLRIYALTAQALPEERQVILEAGFNGILMKPFREADVLALLLDTVPTEQLPEIQLEKDFDLSSLEQMTFGDTEKMIRLLNQYVEDSREDVRQLSDLQGDESEVPFLLHKLAGRSAQLGAARLAALMRELEILAYKEEHEAPSSVTKDDLKAIAAEVESVMGKIEMEISRLSGISPSYSKEFSGQY